MALVQSLLTAIVRADGDALVMHVGERPYVVASSGTIELSAHGMNLEAMSGMLHQLLPHDALRALDDFGAVEHDLIAPASLHGERFSVVAARGGEDVWIELRRHRHTRSPMSREPEPTHAAVSAAAPPAPSDSPQEVPSAAAPATADVPPALVVVDSPVSENTGPEPQHTSALEASSAGDLGNELEEQPMQTHRPDPNDFREPNDAPVQERSSELDPARNEGRGIESASPSYETTVRVPVPVASETAAPAAKELPVEAQEPEPVAAVSAAPPTSSDRWATPDFDEAPPVVVPLTRSVRIETGRGLSSRSGGIDRLLRVAASHGASALYLPSQARPYIRVDGDVRLLEGEPELTSPEVESAVLEVMPENAREAMRRGEPTEWTSDLADVGRIRCTTFCDYRGTGALFQMISARAASAEQLGLSREIQSLSTESEGLVVVAGPRGSGKSTLIAAFVDLVNRQRASYVITLERQIRLVHDNRNSLISQREIRGSAQEVVAQARTALRENPDVLVIEDLRSPDVLQVALDAAGSGLLVFMSVTASCATSAIERVIDLVPMERKRPVQAILGETLRGVVAQVLLRKSGGGRLAARELLLGTASVTSLVTDGQTTQLPLAIDSGRRHGMVPLNDALVAFLQSGAVDVREVYRKASDRQGLLTLLKREGIDTSFVERLA